MKKPKIIKLGTSALGVQRETVKDGIKNTSIQIFYNGEVPKGRLMKKSKIVSTLKFTKAQMNVLIGALLFAHRQLTLVDANVDFNCEDLEQLGHVINAQVEKCMTKKERDRAFKNVCINIDAIDTYGTVNPKA